MDGWFSLYTEAKFLLLQEYKCSYVIYTKEGHVTNLGFKYAFLLIFILSRTSKYILKKKKEDHAFLLDLCIFKIVLCVYFNCLIPEVLTMA